jgi:hypothetical protein
MATHDNTRIEESSHGQVLPIYIAGSPLAIKQQLSLPLENPAHRRRFVGAERVAANAVFLLADQLIHIVHDLG